MRLSDKENSASKSMFGFQRVHQLSSPSISSPAVTRLWPFFVAHLACGAADMNLADRYTVQKRALCTALITRLPIHSRNDSATRKGVFVFLTLRLLLILLCVSRVS